MNIPDHVAPLVTGMVFAVLGSLAITVTVSLIPDERKNKALWALSLITCTLGAMLAVMMLVLWLDEQWVS